MGKSLRMKLTLGALGIVIIICIAIIVVVSFFINRQNLQTVKRDLEKAGNVCQVELNERQHALAEEINRMIVENNLGATVKFLHEFSDNALSMTESTYFKLAEIALNKAKAINFNHIGIYDIEGNLQVFAVRQADKFYQFGFYKSPKAHINMNQKDEPIDEGAWKSTEQSEEIKISIKLNDAPPAEKQLLFTNKDGLLCVEVFIPVFSIDYDDNGEPVSKQFGVAHVVKELGKDFVDRLHLLTGMSINIFAGNQLSLGQLKEFNTIDSETFGDTKTKTSLNEIVLNRTKYFHKAIPAFGKTDINGSVVMLQPDDIVKNNTYQMVKILTIVSLGCLILIVPVVILFSKSIVRPVLHIVARMKDIAEGEGDLKDRITITAKDEIGQLAENFNRFVEKIQIMVSQVKDNLELLNESSSSLSDISSTLASGAEKSSEKANGVAASGEEMSSNMNSIAATMEEAATNITTVSNNARQMSESIQDVKENTVTAREISDQAVLQAKKASKQVEDLGNAASEIQKVVETITDISEQVNLLSLNATIEAARAGEAGKGFAVVANEIKELANQTATASDEIKKKVSDIRNSTKATVTEIETITKVNNEINDIVQTTSKKVEEQSIATNDIAENVSQASLGISEVNENVSQSSSVAADIAKEIVDVTHTADEISTSSKIVKSRATELSDLSEQLKNIVDRFKV